MMTYEIRFKKCAEKYLVSRTLKERKKILSEIYKLPNCNHIKKMEGYNNRYRLRIGDVRVIYEIYNDLLEILIVDIGNRGDVYK